MTAANRHVLGVVGAGRRSPGWRLLADVLVVVFAAQFIAVWLAGDDSPGRVGSAPFLLTAAGLVGPLATLHYGWRMTADAALGWRPFPGDGLAFTLPIVLAGVIAADSGMWLSAISLFGAVPNLLVLLVLIRRHAPTVVATSPGGANDA